jgi:hypothetical protein
MGPSSSDKQTDIEEVLEDSEGLSLAVDELNDTTVGHHVEDVRRFE